MAWHPGRLREGARSRRDVMRRAAAVTSSLSGRRPDVTLSEGYACYAMVIVYSELERAFELTLNLSVPRSPPNKGTACCWCETCLSTDEGQVSTWATLIATARKLLDMTKNMGTIDRVVRTVIAVVLIALIASGQITATWAVVAGVVTVAFLLTSAVGFCPAYWPFKISTRREAGQSGP